MISNIYLHIVVEYGIQPNLYLTVFSFTDGGLKVWEYLYIMKNPITAESQQKKIDVLKDYKSKAMVTIEMKNIKLNRIKKANLITRLKWVFTGVNN